MPLNEKLKVLWFTPTPGLSGSYLNNKLVGGDWIKSLEKYIQDKIELSIVFYYTKSMNPFHLNKTTYFPINKFKYGRVSKIKNRLLNKIQTNDDIGKWIEIVNEVKPDLIHIHGTENIYGLIQKYTSIPTVVSIQGNISVYKHKYFSGISYFGVIRYSKLVNWIFFRTCLHTYSQYCKLSKTEKKIFNISSNIIGRTSWDKRISKVLSPQSKYYHNDEILRDAFYENKWEKTQVEIIKLFTTTGPNIYKGLETILYAANLLDASNIKYNWQVAGIHSEDEIVNIASKSTRKKISTSINFLGKLEEHELVDKILKSDIYISPSHIENSPNSLCEALILGIPCIATNAGGTSSLLKDGEDGILIQDGDPYVMVGAILELIEKNSKAISYGKSARLKALVRHDPNKIVDGLLKIYNDIKLSKEVI